jgi:hypothetical protein
MSVRRPQAQCPLCLASLDESLASAIFYAYQEERSPEDACRRLRRAQIVCDPPTFRAHIQYHRPLQPPPRRRLVPERALRAVASLPPRRRALVELVARVSALNGTQLAELFYWRGAESQLNAARAACYRDLSRLVRENVLYRWYPPTARSPGGVAVRSWQHRLSFYFLGRDAVPYVSARWGREPVRGREWFASAQELPPAPELYVEAAAAGLVSGLAREARRRQAAGGAEPALAFEVESWHAGSRLALPARTRVQPSWGIASFRLRRSAGDVQCPFLYEYDDGLRDLSEASELVLRYLERSLLRGLWERFPALARAGVVPPLLLVSPDPFRLQALRRSVQRLARQRGATAALPVVLAGDQRTLRSGALFEERWLSLWDGQRSPRRYRLSDILVRDLERRAAAGLEEPLRCAKAPRSADDRR